MNIEQIYTGCLAQGAYFVSSNGEAAVIDPLREVQPYIDRADGEGVKIKYIFETHFHADFVSGHIDLAKKTGATIIYGPTDMPLGFDAHVAKDGEVFHVGDLTFTALHTPGHTMESTTYLLKDEQGKEKAIFTGDTLFIGDVGRPDLAQKVVEDLTQDKLARLLYHSLRDKIMSLPDDVIVYPAHGAGSACGKNMSKETFDTLGNQKETNYALRADMTEDEFVKEVTAGLTTPPAYFPENVMMNIQGYENLDSILKRGLTPLEPNEFKQVAEKENALIIDTRSPNDFASGHIPGSIFIGIDGGFAPWVGTLVEDIKQPILIVADEGREEEVVTRLSRVGYDNTLGFLLGGIQAWKLADYPVETVETLSPEEAYQQYSEGHKVLDVRKNSEHLSERIEGVENMPLDYINHAESQLDTDTPYLVHCAGGYRSMIFISIMQARGHKNLKNINQGFRGIKEIEKFPLTDYVCPTTLL